MIKPVFKKFLCIAVLAAFSSLTQAGTDGGMIHFTGAIVEGGCGITPQDQKVEFSCYKQGTATISTVALDQLANGSIHSDSLMHTDIQYLNPQRSLAIVTVAYQ